MSAEERKLDVHEREQAIFRHLREIDSTVGATVREVHERPPEAVLCATPSPFRRTTS
jgi:hypothetical protein